MGRFQVLVLVVVFLRCTQAETSTSSTVDKVTTRTSNITGTNATFQPPTTTPQLSQSPPTSEAGVPTSEAGVPTSEAGIPTSEAGVPTSEAGIPTSEAGTSPGGSSSPSSTTPDSSTHPSVTASPQTVVQPPATTRTPAAPSQSPPGDDGSATPLTSAPPTAGSGCVSAGRRLQQLLLAAACMLLQPLTPEPGLSLGSAVTCCRLSSPLIHQK
ncbi:PREDICTED: uncharacterized protein PB18E9.04c-like [Poecilia mexicana]|uniref:uncharacterized protein PB18E9.04c-like n=1 Tax=Poecilia mexicana TaxID=48701 RepID=UPI00072ED87B|nr:PREDICTED: uncharacterized protein PB18E9.04c-like [Poecilia mexicana]